MTSKPKAAKFNIRRAPKAPPADATSAEAPETPAEEKLTGRQLRTARRIAAKHGLKVSSDLDAVKQLRDRGIDPFSRSAILELVVPEDQKPKQDAQLPQAQPKNLPAKHQPKPMDRSAEIMRMQRDIVRRRRANIAMLFSRIAVFVLLPTALFGYYFYEMATPMYATHSEFVVTKAESQNAAAGFGSLFQGTGLATQQDSVGVQSFLQSREALLRLDEDHGFRAHFSQDWIDPLQRLDPEATMEETFDVYSDRVKIGYDPSEGLLRMEVIAADPETSVSFSRALIDYAETEVDLLTQRVREDQMSGARESYEEAEARRSEALGVLERLQAEVQSIDPVGETAALVSQISTLESQMQTRQLELQALLSAQRPNAAAVAAVEGDIERIQTLISDLRQRATRANAEGISQATKNAELRTAEENYQFQTVMVQAALQQMETARIEANRQRSYLALNVEPIPPDEPTYPRAFENTILAFLIFSGIYLMISLTASILREQVSS